MGAEVGTLIRYRPMNAREHIEQAEQYLELAKEELACVGRAEPSLAKIDTYAGLAQSHATLALAKMEAVS